jgi:hypothetical protein
MKGRGVRGQKPRFAITKPPFLIKMKEIGKIESVRGWGLPFSEVLLPALGGPFTFTETLLLALGGPFTFTEVLVLALGGPLTFTESLVLCIQGPLT